MTDPRGAIFDLSHFDPNGPREMDLYLREGWTTKAAKFELQARSIVEMLRNGMSVVLASESKEYSEAMLKRLRESLTDEDIAKLRLQSEK